MNAVAMVTRCTRHQQGDLAAISTTKANEVPDSGSVAPDPESEEVPLTEMPVVP